MDCSIKIKDWSGLIRIIKVLFFSILLLCLTIPAYSQDSLFDGKKNKVGFITGYGFQNQEVLNTHISVGVDYYYEVYFFALQGYRNVYRKRRFGVDILIQPQYNLTNYIYDTKWIPGIRKGYEVGINIGVVIRQNLRDDLMSFYFCGGIGPQYISGELNRQASGFIFSDNLDAGINIKVYKDFFIDFRVGLRHISPAGLTYPDAGINNLMVYGGGYWCF